MTFPIIYSKSPLKLFVVVMFFVCWLAATAAAQSQTQPAKLGIKPVGTDDSYFTLSMAPGETRELTVELGNFGESKVRARTYAADAYTIVNGGFGARLDGAPINGTTRWLDYPTSTIELEARTGVNRTFKVAVPAEAKPGEYITSLVIQDADAAPASSSGPVTIKQIVRQAIAVAITVPGPRSPHLEIGAASYRTLADRSHIAVAVKNDGNVLLKPSGEFVLRDTRGIEVSRYPIKMGSVYAGTDTFVDVPFAGRLEQGDYTVELTLTDQKEHTQAVHPPVALNVPAPETDAQPQAIDAAPAAAISRTGDTAMPQSGSLARAALIGTSLAVSGGLFLYWRQRRKLASSGR